MKKFVACLLCLVISAALLVGCGSGSGSSGATEQTPAEQETEKEVYTVKIGISNGLANENDPETIFINTLQAELEATTQGGIVLEVYPNLQLGSMEEMRDMIISGTLEAMFCNINTVSAIYPDAMVLVCPGVFADEAEINAVLRSEWGQAYFKKMAEETNLYVAGLCSNGMRCYTSNKSPLTTVESIKGHTIRVMQNPLCVEMAEAIGINAVPMAGSEMYTAMQSGTVDGQENPISSIINDKTYEVQKYMVLDKHMPSIMTLEVGYAFYQSMPEEYQKAFDAAALKASEAMAEAVDRVNVEGIDYLKSVGMEIYEPTAEELAAWQAPVYEACSEYLKKEIGSETLDSLAEAIKAYRGE